MIGPLKARLAQKHRRAPYPSKAPVFSDRYRGVPVIDSAKCAACVAACPVAAITVHAHKPVMDLGKCLFCGDCAAVCPNQAVTFSQ